MPHAMGRKQGILVSVSERTVNGLEPGTLEIDLRDSDAGRQNLPHTFDARAIPDGDARSRWFRRQLTGPSLILTADVAVLVGYAIAAPGWWRMLGVFWVTTVLAFLLGKLYRPRLHVALLDDIPTMLKSVIASAILVAGVVDRVRGTYEITHFAAYAAAGLMAHVLFRAGAYWIIRWARRTGR